MKILIVLLLLVACGKVDEEFEGIYARYAAGEFSQAWDTLIVYRTEPGSDNYLIRRKTYIQRLDDEAVIAGQRKSEEMLAAYDAHTGQLKEQKSGRIFTKKGDGLLFGVSEYIRISK